MKSTSALLLLASFLFSATFYAQEMPSEKKIAVVMNRPLNEGSYINFKPQTPSLTHLSAEIPNTGSFTIRSVNFDNKEQARQININQYLRDEESRIQSRIVELDSPVNIGSGKSNKGATISITGNNDPRSYFKQNFTPHLPSSGTQNSVYRDAGEATGFYYLTRYNPFYRGYSY